jgi:hypothetical protein
MDEEQQQDWRECEVEAFRRLLAARTHRDAKQLTTAEDRQATEEAYCGSSRPRVSLFEPDQPD